MPMLTISRTGYHRADVVANDVMPFGIQVMTQVQNDAQATAIARWMLDTIEPVIG